MKANYVWPVVLLLLLWVLPAQAQEDAAVMDEPTIAALVQADSSFSTLAVALEAAGLTEALAAEGPFTVFAPTNEAFEALPEGTLAALLAPEGRDQLVRILQYHVVPGLLTAADLDGTRDVEPLAGPMLNVTGGETGVYVSSASVVQPDVAASNGVIHVIDAVLLPPSEGGAP